MLSFVCMQAYFLYIVQTQGLAAGDSAFQWMRTTFGLRNLNADSTPNECEGMLNLWMTAIDCHRACAHVDTKAIRAYYEDALDRFDVQHLWSAYRQFEMECGDAKTAAAIAWRAKQAGCSLRKQ